jgi:ubiquinol-cytochrome c reductase iron-sulfur subunit
MAEAAHGSGHGDQDGTRRDFLMMATAGMAAVAAGGALWPLIDSLNPAADALAVSSLEVDLAPISEGQAITVMWRGTPVFIRHRTAAEIEDARSVPQDDLPDPALDEDRVQKAEWLVMVGVCTHLGCIPLGQKVADKKGDYDGWFCPCHGSHYDTSGRIRKGPAPENLPVPPYAFDGDTLITIG